MKLESTRLVDQTLPPKTRPLRWNQTIWDIRPAAPERKETASRSCRRAGGAADGVEAETGARARATAAARTLRRRGRQASAALYSATSLPQARSASGLL